MAPACRSVGWMASNGAFFCRQASLHARTFSARPQFPRPAFRHSNPVRLQQSFHSRSRLLSNVPPSTPRANAASSAPETVVISARAQRPRRPLRVYIYMAGFLVLGLGMGQFVRAVVVPPPLPVPNTEEDEVYKARIRKDIDTLPIVQELRARRDGWLEYEAHMTASESERAAHMTAGAMAGARAVAVQRIFWNKAEHRLVAVVFVGGAITGWPGVTHGGAVATLLQENLERVANGPEVYPENEQRAHWLDHFDINYRKPSQAHRVYLIRAEIEDDPAAIGVLRDHIRVKATMEDAVTGLLTADATGRCTAGPVKWTREEGASLWSNLTKLVS